MGINRISPFKKILPIKGVNKNNRKVYHYHHPLPPSIILSFRKKGRGDFNQKQDKKGRIISK